MGQGKAEPPRIYGILPTQYWISRVREEAQELTSDFTTYVYGSRMVASLVREAYIAACKVRLIWKFLGVQNELFKMEYLRSEGMSM